MTHRQIANPWTTFDFLSRQEQAALLSQGFSFKLSDMVDGWGEVEVRALGETHRHRVSDKGPTTWDFKRMLLTLQPEGSMRCLFADEFSSFPWQVSRRFDIACVKTPFWDEPFFLPWQTFVNQIIPGGWEELGSDPTHRQETPRKPFLPEDAWVMFGALTPERQQALYDQYSLFNAQVKVIARGWDGAEWAQLRININDDSVSDYLEDLWERVLGEENVFQQRELLDTYTDTIFRHNVEVRLVVPLIALEHLLAAITNLESGQDVSLGTAEGFWPHHLVFSRHDDLVFFDMTEPPHRPFHPLGVFMPYERMRKTAIEVRPYRASNS